MKRIVGSFLAGIVATLAFLYHQGPENLVQIGLKLAAFQADYDFQAVPRESAAVTYETRDLMVPAPAKKVARR
jgi:hypothetical protein